MASNPALSAAAQASRSDFGLRIAAFVGFSGGGVSGETQLSTERVDSGCVSRKNLRQGKREELCSSRSKFQHYRNRWRKPRWFPGTKKRANMSIATRI